MAGITNPAFRTLCREFGAGLYVCEMITTRALVERNEKTLQMVRATADEKDAFSVQLYGVDPATVGRAVEMLVDEGVAGTRPAHIDLNFGCPVPKVTRKGGGSALPWRRVLFRDIVRSAVRAAKDVPVTVKTRIGIDADHVTYLDAGRTAQDEGAAAITLHGRTADQLYSGTADWSHIARLVEAVDIPVLGNGDIWEADDALRMVAETGCAGVVIGRGCLGRPWLFGDLAAAFAGTPQRGAAVAGARSPRSCTGTPTLLARGAGRAARLHRLPQARRLVPQGLLGRLRRPPRAGDGQRPRRARRAARRHPRPALSGRRPRRPAGADHPAAAGGAARGLAGRPRRPAPAGGGRARGERRMTTGPFLYDDDPAPLHTGTPRRRQGCSSWSSAAPSLVAVLMVGAPAVVKGSPEEQAREVAGVFLAALDKGDIETAYGLLCEDERAATSPDEVGRRYLGPADGAGRSWAWRRPRSTATRRRRCTVDWADGDAEWPDRRQRGRPVRLRDRAEPLTAGRYQVTCVTRPRARAGRLPPRRSTAHHQWDV